MADFPAVSVAAAGRSGPCECGPELVHLRMVDGFDQVAWEAVVQVQSNRANHHGHARRAESPRIRLDLSKHGRENHGSPPVSITKSGAWNNRGPD